MGKFGGDGLIEVKGSVKNVFRSEVGDPVIVVIVQNICNTVAGKHAAEEAEDGCVPGLKMNEIVDQLVSFLDKIIFLFEVVFPCHDGTKVVGGEVVELVQVGVARVGGPFYVQVEWNVPFCAHKIQNGTSKPALIGCAMGVCQNGHIVVVYTSSEVVWAFGNSGNAGQAEVDQREHNAHVGHVVRESVYLKINIAGSIWHVEEHNVAGVQVVMDHMQA